MFEEKSKIEKYGAKLRNPGGPGWLFENGVDRMLEEARNESEQEMNDRNVRGQGPRLGCFS